MEIVFQWVIGISSVIACLAVLGQAMILLAMYRAVIEAQKAGKEVQEKFGPLVDRFEPLLGRLDRFITDAAKILEENGPRVAQVTTESIKVVESARIQVDRIGELVEEANGRAKARIAQIDETVEHTVEQVEHASEAVRSAVMKPVKEVNGFVAGVKAALNTYAQGGRRNSPDHITQDEEMFI